MFRLEELLKATQGKLLRGSICGSVKSISTDTRTLKSGEAFLAIKGDNFDGHGFIGEAIRKKAGALIVQLSAVSCQLTAKIPVIQVEDTIKALGDIAHFHRKKFDLPVVAVTGSNGKTTTKEMIARILEKKYKVLKSQGTENNHIGLPQTLLKLNSRHQIVVLEIGTNHFGEVEYLSRISQPNIAVITNVGPAHLEHFGTLAGVFREKISILSHLRAPGIAILNADDAFLAPEVQRNTSKRIAFYFGIEKRADFSASGIILRNGKLEFSLNKKAKLTISSFGRNNIYNALAAIAVGRIFSLSYPEINKQLSTFSFPKSRLNFMRLGKIRFIDDTYNANPASLRHALAALENIAVRGRKIFIMGDMLELGERKEALHYEAGLAAAEVCDTLITVGGLAQKAAEAACQGGLDTGKVFICASAKEARELLLKSIAPTPDDIILVKGSRGIRMEELFRDI